MAIEKISAGVSEYTQTTSRNANVQSKDANIVEAEETVKKTSDGSARVSEGSVEALKAEGKAALMPDEETVRKKIGEINRQLNKNTVCQYGVHEETQRITLKFVDKDTQEVIKEFPAEKTLEMIAKVWELAGLFVDERR